MRKSFIATAVSLVTTFALTTVASVGSAAPPPTNWYLDRINQRLLPLDGNVATGSTLTGAGVDIYIVDTGVLATHEQFGGRVSAGIDVPSIKGTSIVNPPSSDCDGHGTHVAGLAAGSSVGVASQARVIAVRVLDCNGEGSVSEVVDALKWIRSHHRSGIAAVVNLSLGVERGDDGTAIEKAVLALIDEGIVVVVAAGNGDKSETPFDACQIAPGVVDRALTVGAVTLTDAVASYSNYGTCVDLFAPGGDRTRSILSSWNNSPTDYQTDVGTSMASPMVAGYAALLAQQQPGLCVDSIASAIVARATPDVLTGVTNGSPNRLLFLDTSPVTVGVPGRPSNVITSTDSGALIVSWDPPCDGGSPITSTRVSLLERGKVVARRIARDGAQSVRFTGLTLGAKYQVVVKAENVIGPGIATVRVKTVATKHLRRGYVVRTSLLANNKDAPTMKWSVAAKSRKICRVISNPTRLVGLSPGICKVALRTLAGQTPVMRAFRIHS